jgi:hypothetical protein
MYKTSFFVCTLKCGEQLIHTEIIKAVPVIEGTSVSGKLHSINFRLRTVLINILYARDSMSFHSRVRPIRERIEETKKKTEISLILLDSNNVEEQYQHKLDNRDNSLGYLVENYILI